MIYKTVLSKNLEKSNKRTEILNYFNQRGLGHWAVNYTSPESFIITFSQPHLGLLLNFDQLVYKIDFQRFNH